MEESDAIARLEDPVIGVRLATIEQFLTLGRFRPASVQRSYCWEPQDALRLLEDLEAMFVAVEAFCAEIEEEERDREPEIDENPPVATFFLGSVVLAEGEDPENPLDAIEIYDGLQRTTTLTILFAVLRDLDPSEDGKAALRPLIANEHGYRLDLRHRDQTLVRDAQAEGGALRQRAVTANLDLGKQIQRVKNLILRRYESWPPERRRRLAWFIAKRAVITVTQVLAPALARQIFVSTNLYGKLLRPTEILKGQLVGCAVTLEAEAEVERLWGDITASLGPDVEKFLAAVDLIERAEPQNRQWQTDLGDYARRTHPGDAISLWMAELVHLEQCWRALKQAEADPGDDELHRAVWRLSFLPWDDWRPLALWRWRERQRRAAAGELDSQTETQDRQWFRRLLSRGMALALADLSAQDRRLIYAKAMRTAKAGRDPTTQGRATLFPTDRQRRKIDRALRSQIKDDWLWSALTRLLETAEWRESLPALMQSATVEHVLPRNPERHSESAAAAKDSADYDRLCYALGNLAMMSRAANNLVANLDYRAKRDVLIEEARRHHMLRSVVTEEMWGAPEIDARTETLRLQVWRLLDLQPPK